MLRAKVPRKAKAPRVRERRRGVVVPEHRKVRELEAERREGAAAVVAASGHEGRPSHLNPAPRI